MAETVTITIEDDGTLVFVHTDALVDLMDQGRSETRRVSEVEPAPGGGWTARMICDEAAPVLGPFRTRGEALAAERQWLADHKGL